MPASGHDMLTIIRGFAAQVGEKILESVSAMGQQYQVLVEEDQEVHQMGGGAGLH
jgi:hypothetical protein